jgi:hypothetical protein
MSVGWTYTCLHIRESQHFASTERAFSGFVFFFLSFSILMLISLYQLLHMYTGYETNLENLSM